ncbi:MAG: hydrogenase 3 maturation endopeptidase HyCI [candidate division WOR-3 bacterium]
MAEVVIIGIGNRSRGDDGVGSKVVEMLSDLSNAKVINAGTVPENYIEPILKEKPSRILLVDACKFGGQPGEFRLFPIGDFHQLISGGFSTHTLSLAPLAELLATESDARVWLLGIEPAETNLSEGISPMVNLALPAIVNFIRSWVTNPD